MDCKVGTCTKHFSLLTFIQSSHWSTQCRVRAHPDLVVHGLWTYLFLMRSFIPWEIATCTFLLQLMIFLSDLNVKNTFDKHGMLPIYFLACIKVVFGLLLLEFLSSDTIYCWMSVNHNAQSLSKINFQNILKPKMRPQIVDLREMHSLNHWW